MYNESFTKSGEINCTRCTQMDYNYILLIGMTIWIMVAISIAIKSTVRSSE